MSAPAIDTVVFDVGGVLLDWNPEYLFLGMFDGDQVRMRWFLENVCTPEWNAQQDCGRPFAEAVAEATRKHPDYAKYIAAYWERWIDTVSGPIPGTVVVLSKLRARGLRLLGLSNWSAETFPLMRRKYEFLSWLETTVVSGEEKVAKPDPQIFDCLTSRLGVVPQRALFIDDSPRHVAAGRALGFNTHLFTSPEALEIELIKRGLLPVQAPGSTGPLSLAGANVEEPSGSTSA